MSPKFGTSGLRGLVAELTDPLCAGYAEAFLSSTGTSGKVLIGRDLRGSSPRIAAAAAAGAARLGVQAVDCGVLPTPALALAAHTRGCPAIMITGSHIPDDRNGIKFYTREGEITKADETRISAAFATTDANDLAPASMQSDTTALSAYRSRFTDFFTRDALSGLTIGVYEHSSAARDVLGDVLQALGATTVAFGRAERFSTRPIWSDRRERRRIQGGKAAWGIVRTSSRRGKGGAAVASGVATRWDEDTATPICPGRTYSELGAAYSWTEPDLRSAHVQEHHHLAGPRAGGHDRGDRSSRAAVCPQGRGHRQGQCCHPGRRRCRRGRDRRSHGTADR